MPEPFEPPYEDFGLTAAVGDGHGAAQRLEGAVVPAGIAASGITIPPNGDGLPAGPAILLVFRHYCHPHRRWELSKFIVPDGYAAAEGTQPTGEGLRSFAALIAGIADTLADPDLVADGMSRALDAMAADAARLEPALAPRCPGCGALLFGDVADRGACLACFPETVPDDVLDAAFPLDTAPSS